MGRSPFPLCCGKPVPSVCLVPASANGNSGVTCMAFQLSWCRAVDRCVMGTERHHVCLEEGALCSASLLQRPWRGACGIVCSSPGPLLCLKMRGWAPAPRRFPGSAQSCCVSPGRTQEERVPLSPSGGPADSQGCHTAGPLCARTHQSCLDRLSLFFFLCPLRLPVHPASLQNPSLRAFPPLCSLPSSERP